MNSDLEAEQSDEQSPNGGVPVSAPLPQPANSDTPPVEPLPRTWLGRLWPALILVLLLVAGGLLAWQHDFVTDWTVTRGYHAPSTIQKLVEDDTMTAYARRLFYVNKPQIESRDSFNRHCSNATDQVTVLGCFVGNRQGIYVYDVTDPRLSGIQQVTAAHEMLHQAYERLSRTERDRVDKLLVDYSKTVTDPDLLAKFAAYKKSEPNDVVNEMHSVFGTEVANLPPALEQYYKQYFTDRHKITQLHAQYQQAFTERTKQITDYDTRIEALKKQIDANKVAIEAQQKDLEAQRAQLNAYVASNQIATYNAAVPGFNARVDAYRRLVADANALIDQYNSLIDARNAIAVQEQQLQQALDSHAAPAAKQ